MLNDGVFGVGGNDIMDETANLVNAVSYSHSGSANTAGQSMMSQSMPSTPGQNPNVMMPGMVSMQQAQSGAQLSSGGMGSYHQGTMHGYQQSEVPQKLHQYSIYGSQLQPGSMAGQYVSGGPRLHHLSDPMSSIPDQPQQASPRTVVPGQMYQNRNMAGAHYSQQIPHNAAASQMTQGSSQYPSHYSNVQHHSMQQQHGVQQVNQNADMWQNSMPHSQMTRPCMPASQSYSQHQMVPGQHATTNLNHSPMTMQGQRSTTPNQSQYMTNQEYTTPLATNQQSSMQRPPVYNMNSTSVNQNGSMVGQMNNTPQSAMSQTLNSLSQTDQAITFPQGHYVGSQATTNRPLYNAATAVGSSVGHASQQHVVGQQMINVRPPVHQMGYSSVSSRVNSGPQHTNSVPPGSPARLQQYHPPFSPNQAYTAPQPSPRPTNPESATPPHLHYSNSQPHTQAPMSPQYRNPFPSQVTHSPQHLTPTPPTEVSVPPPLTPERVLQSSTPQSQGSYHSPSTTHLTSPGQGHSPGNSNAPSSLQHLEQMVLPRVSTGPSTTPTASSVSPSGPNSGMSHNSGASGNYYGHLSSAQLPQQHQMHIPPVGDARPQPQSPAFSHISQPHSHHSYLNQPHSVSQLPSPTVSSVPNSQPLQPNISTISTLSNSSLLSEESIPVESSQHSVVSYGSDNSSSIPSVSVTETTVPRSIPANVGPLPTSDQITQISNASSTSSDSVLSSSHQYNMLGKGPYQGSSSSITFEMQQIQQELQQLYGMHQSPETHEKVKVLQERLRYLQTQQSNTTNTTSAPLNSNVPPASPHYPRSMMYNSGNTASYVHQPMMQPQTVHYNPQTQQTTTAPDVVPASQIAMNIGSINAAPPENMPSIPEPGSFDSESMGPNHYPASGSEIMPTLSLQDQPDMTPDPYEMTFNDEPPPKMKRRPPKEPKPKKPKSPKQPKSPKPKKPKKSKKKEAPPADGLSNALDNTLPSQETVEGTPLVPDGEKPLVEGEASPTKAKKPRKRKAKETDGEPKEPKPKKPRKRPEKKSKQAKAEDVAVSENAPNDGNNNSLEKADDEKPADSAADANGVAVGDDETKENVEVDKETKEKKSKSKSPKTPKDGVPKETKKSSPKKKLPKIALKFTSKKKKKKPLAVSDHSDIERTPPPSPEGADGVTKRRSARNTERKKYTDDIELHLSDDETIEMEFVQSSKQDGKLVQVVVDNHNEDYMVVEKILAVRTVQKEVETNAGSDAENSTPETVGVEEYYVKYKNLSYIHCEWKTLEELEKGDRRFIQKVKRFKQKKETFNFFDFLEEEPFNPDYIEVDRVLDVNEIKEVVPSEESATTEEQSTNSPSEEQVQSDEKPKESEKEIQNEESKEPQTDELGQESQEKELKEDVSKPEDSETSPVEKTDPENAVQDTVESTDISSTQTAVINSESKEPVDEEGSKNSKDISDTDPAKTSDENKEEKPSDDDKVAIEEDNKNYKITRHYLVKWRALTYEESTWELEDDVDRDKIEQFLRFKDPPPKEKWKIKKRPKPSEWDQLPESPVYKGGNTLREYQLEGVNWLTFCWYNSQNCILADEMGLGKTIQSITFLNEIDKYGIPGPFLVIAPLSTIGNWQREFETWTDLNAITYHGSSPSRNMILEYEMYWKNEKGERILDVFKFQVMITTFEIILTDCMELKSIPWRCVIIDEAHRLKNRNCKLLEGLRMLNTEHRVLLTGTPLQNNVEELFSLLNFLEPNRFASTEAFLEEFGNLKTESQVDKLKALLKPMMLRRLKEDVEKSLAPKEETVVEVELTNVQKKYYRAILERNFTFLTKGNCYSNVPNLMNTMMELRKCCIHPFLINGAEEQIVNDYKQQHEGSLGGHLNAMIQASGKLVLMDKLLPRLRSDGHRVLVFSQMVRCLDILEDYLVQKRYPYERIDGRVRGNLRQAAIDRFCKPDSDRFVFLLCTRAGGLGINLTAADTVIIFDSDWNPQNDLQAQARCHRIGQSKAVKVYRLICRNTYEREMFDKASLKLGLDKAVLQSMSMKENVGMNQQMSKKEIEDLLRKGAYGALMEDDNAGDKFCEEDIDQILQRRTQVITLESGTKGSTFSKATFASASTRSDIEIDDPNFWEKWAKKANLDVDELKNRNELIIQEPRRRTQTRRFGTDDLIDLSELESSDDDDESISARTRASRKGSKNRSKNRGRDDDDYMDDLPPGNWTRAECYKMEKGLLTFGWGRWDECMALGQFRRRLSHKDCEEISRTILLYCLLHYKGDEKIKSFIWDLICPNYEGEQRIHKNHSESETPVEPDSVFDGFSAHEQGLSAPVPRGRKGKKIKKETKTIDQIIEECEWTKEEVSNPDSLLNDEIYKRHLNRHSNKVLLRVRLLYYLRHEIIGDLHDLVFMGKNASEIPLYVPPADGEPPTPWWDVDLDKSLLLGIYKHGFERYNIMRQDPTLCFLSRCGPPDGAALLAELNNVNNPDDELEDNSIQKDKDEEMEPLSPSSEHEPPKTIPNNYLTPLGFEMGVIQFPSVTDVNTRVRRLVTAFQRNNKKLEIRNAQKARKIERREKFEAAIRERELKKRELQQRKWSRREEADFYRTISSFGVEYNDDTKEYNWSKFRGIARLERKYDETLAEYYKCFYAMCKRVCGRELTEEEEQLSMNVEPISEERASRCLQRVELLNKIREEILGHPELDERLKLCQPSMDLPDWWICGKHDKDLLIGAAKHGLSRMDYHLLHDPNLSFKDVLKNFPNAKTIQIGNMLSSTPIGCSSPLNIYQTDDGMILKDENIRKLKEELPVSADELSIKEEVQQPKLVIEIPETEKEEKADVDKSKHTDDLIENKIDLGVTGGDNVDTQKESKLVKVEDPVTEDKSDIVMKEEISKETEDSSKNVKEECEVMEVCDTKKESDTPTVDVTSKPPGDAENESAPLGTDSMDVDNTPDTSGELKIDEDVKAEDEETDIETDLRKDEDDAKESVPIQEKSDEISTVEKVKSPQPISPALQDNEKDDQKYDCDTDTESKCNFESIQTGESEESPLVKMERAIKSEKCDSILSEKLFPKVKQEELMFEDGLRDKYNMRKMFPKDDLLHSHVDDSQGCMSQNDDVLSQASFNLESEMGEPTVAQLLAFTNGNAVRWPKDKVLQIRLEHIVHAVEKNEWPIIRHTFLPTFPPVPPNSSTPIPHPPVIASPVSHRASPVPSVSSQGHSGEVTPQATPEHTPQRESLLPEIPTPTPPDFSVMRKSPLQHIPQPPVSDSSKHRRRRRRRRFEIEAERAKLRQLLSHNMQQQQQQHQQQLQHVQQFLASSSLRNKIWDDHVEDKVQHPNVPSPAPAVAAASPTIPPPAHQNSSPRMTSTMGSLDLRVKSTITPPTPFTPLPAPQKSKAMPVESPANVGGSPTSPIDLSASSSGAGSSNQMNSSYNNTNQPTVSKTQGHSKSKEKRGARGGSRIDALALNLQARKQQQLMQEQHHPLADMGSMLERTSDKSKDHSEMDDAPPPSRHHSHHHLERRMEDEEAKLRKKRLQYSEESVRKALSRSFDMSPAPAHSSFLPNMGTNSSRMNMGSGKSDDHTSGTNPILDPSSLMHHDFKKWIDEHPELVAANPNLVAAAAAAMAFSPVSSFPSHTELLELPEGRRRGRRPRLDPTKLDYDKITGEENVSVINRLTGKKGNLPNNMAKRIVTPSEKRGRRTAASLLASAHQNLVPPVTTMSFPSTAGLNPLSFANTGMLSGFPNMKFFMDPPKSSSTSTTTSSASSTTSTNPPLFLPFGGLAGMGLTNPLFGFPGFNFPGLQGSSPLSAANIPPSKDHSKDNEKSRGDKESGSSSSRKNTPASSCATSSSMSSTTSLPSSSLPFLYPPGLLYNPLSLGGFTIPPNLPASFGSFTQSGLVNGLGLNNPLFTTSSLSTTLSSAMSSATVTSPATHSILSSAPSVSKSLPHTSPSKLLSNPSHFTDGQETDDESLKSLMGNHEDDDDDLDDGKMEIYDNPDKDDSDKEGFRDSSRRSPASTNTTAHTPAKSLQSDCESVSLAKTNNENPSLESSKSRGMHDDPTSDSTDTESKHS
ncbi:chromodomain-helicase-DNA-binding protein 7 [Trichonephila clavata]|uniref:Chromodomain-helicase-DNA-binding protein 7 n=1 Tax=Trichonephila clavata TaxID=2740835 RepID=A0A8X6GL04_TRICU|nr:chromodomain-helicase-DNA-binding protein 7 [Trichonephila clavata]